MIDIPDPAQWPTTANLVRVFNRIEAARESRRRGRQAWVDHWERVANNLILAGGTVAGE